MECQGGPLKLASWIIQDHLVVDKEGKPITAKNFSAVAAIDAIIKTNFVVVGSDELFGHKQHWWYTSFCRLLTRFKCVIIHWKKQQNIFSLYKNLVK